MKRKIVYIMHRIGAATPAGVEANLADLRRIIRRIHLEHPEVIPFCPYYADVVSLNDHEPDERARGLLCGLELLGRGFIDEAWLTGPAVSAGMKGEIAACVTAGILVEDKIGLL